MKKTEVYQIDTPLFFCVLYDIILQKGMKGAT